MRYPLEVFRAMRDAWPEGKPMAAHLAHDWVEEDGVTPEEAVEIARMFMRRGRHHRRLRRPDPKQAQPVYGRMFQTPFSDRIRNDGGIKTMAVGNIYEADRELDPHMAAPILSARPPASGRSLLDCTPPPPSATATPTGRCPTAPAAIRLGVWRTVRRRWRKHEPYRHHRRRHRRGGRDRPCGGRTGAKVTIMGRHEALREQGLPFHRDDRRRCRPTSPPRAPRMAPSPASAPMRARHIPRLFTRSPRRT